MAAQLRARSIGANYHCQGVPSHYGSNAPLDFKIARIGGLTLDRDRIAVWGVQRSIYVDTTFASMA